MSPYTFTALLLGGGAFQIKGVRRRIVSSANPTTQSLIASHSQFQWKHTLQDMLRWASLYGWHRYHPVPLSSQQLLHVISLQYSTLATQIQTRVVCQQHSDRHLLPMERHTSTTLPAATPMAVWSSISSVCRSYDASTVFSIFIFVVLPVQQRWNIETKSNLIFIRVGFEKDAGEMIFLFSLFFSILFWCKYKIYIIILIQLYCKKNKL